MLCEFLCYLLKKNKKLLHDEIDFLLLKIKMEKIFTHMNSLSEVNFSPAILGAILSLENEDRCIYV